MAVELVTGYAGKAHVSSSEDGARQAGTVGTGMYALETVDEPLKATLENANTVTIGPGDVLINGRHGQLTGSTTFAVPVGTQGMQTSNLLVLRYELAEDETESVTAITLTGEPSASDPQDPALATGSVLDGDSPVDMPLYRVVTTGIETAEPVRLFETVPPIAGLTLGGLPGSLTSDQLPIVPVSKGGTGATTADGAADSLKLVRYATNAASTITGVRVENDPPYSQRVNLWTDGAGGYGLITEDAGISLYNGAEQKAVWTLKPDAAEYGVFKANRTPTLTSLAWETIYNLPPGGYLVGQNASGAPNGEAGYGNLLVGRSGGDRVVALLAYDNGHIYSIYGAKGVGWKRLTEGGSALDLTRVWAGTANSGSTVTCNQAINAYPLLAVRVRGGQKDYSGLALAVADLWEYSGGTVNQGSEIVYNCVGGNLYNSVTWFGGNFKVVQSSPHVLQVLWAGTGSQNTTYGSIQNIQAAHIEEVYVLSTRYGNK